MKITFHKYHGTGNDFILIENRSGKIHLAQEQITSLCNRHFGIGADGLMLLTTIPGYDFGMTYYNSDGNESTMCGNGGRCITAFAHALGIISHSARFLAIDGEHTAEILKDDGSLKMIKLRISDVPTPPQIPPQQGRDASFIRLNTGSPHLVIFVNDFSVIDVVVEGRKHRHDPQFGPEGINVDFVQILDDNTLYVRTYERGVEDQTLSCGTGVTAAALAFSRRQLAVGSPQSPVTSHQSPVTSFDIKTLGGKLIVSFRQGEFKFTDIWLEGPAEYVFQGEIEIPITIKN